VEQQKKSIPIVPIVFVVIAAALVAVVLLGGGSDDTGEAIAYGPVEVTGSIARLPEGGADPALGAPMPEAVGADFAGNTVSIDNDGRPKLLLFLAHW
jgi:hypothetical protein